MADACFAVTTQPLHAHSVALHFLHYNFVKIHQTLQMTPATAASQIGCGRSRIWSDYWRRANDQ